MSLLKTAFTTFTEALFPVPIAERIVLGLGAESSFTVLPRAEHSPIPEACSVFSYKDERVWRLIWSVKYKKSAAGAAIAGYALHRVLRSYLAAMPIEEQVAPRIVVVPMPITSRRRRERGFNQCELLADEVEKLDKAEVEKNISGNFESSDRLVVVRDLLVRKLHKSRQTLKDREERLESARDIFAVNNEVAQKIKDGTLQSNVDKQALINLPMIIVIDDVITTGGTIRDAISTLKKAGFENVWGLSVAH